MKRKYRFKDRAEAEEALAKRERQHNLALRLLHDGVCQIGTTFRKQIGGDQVEAVCYRLDGATGGIMLLKWWNRAGHVTGVEAFYVDEFLEMFRFRDSEVECIQALRGLAWDIYAKREQLLERRAS